MNAPNLYRIALDVMGGDHAPASNLEGAHRALASFEDLYLLLVGDEARIAPLLQHHHITGELAARVKIVHAASQVDMGDKATSILKAKRDSSIRVAAQLVRDGEAHGLVTMGNTGAAMVACKKDMGTLEGVDRPCLASVLPNMKGGPTVLLDVGANVACKPEHIAQFALMGSVYAEEVLGIKSPRIGVLSVGEEEGKGTGTVKEAALALKAMDLNFLGNAEGRDIWNGKFDVIACDGFVGNVVLKSSEALAEGIMRGLRDAIMEGWVSKVGGLLARPAMRRFLRKMDYEEYGGAPLLGVKGVSIIGHGRSSGRAIANAIRASLRGCEHQINDRIESTLQRILPQAGACQD